MIKQIKRYCTTCQQTHIYSKIYQSPFFNRFQSLLTSKMQSNKSFKIIQQTFNQKQTHLFKCCHLLSQSQTNQNSIHKLQNNSQHNNSFNVLCCDDSNQIINKIKQIKMDGIIIQTNNLNYNEDQIQEQTRQTSIITKNIDIQNVQKQKYRKINKQIKRPIRLSPKKRTTNSFKQRSIIKLKPPNNQKQKKRIDQDIKNNMNKRCISSTTGNNKQIQSQDLDLQDLGYVENQQNIGVTNVLKKKVFVNRKKLSLQKLCHLPYVETVTRIQNIQKKDEIISSNKNKKNQSNFA